MVSKWQALPTQPTLYAILLLADLDVRYSKVGASHEGPGLGDPSQTSLPHSAAPLKS